jgi:diacylglycerol kinase (ATP)
MLKNCCTMPESARKLIKSFSNAFSGIAYLIKSQANARIELIFTILVTAAGFFFGISTTEWLVILLCIALVMGLEGVNTAVEMLADKLHPGYDTEIGKAKDLAAGAVLIAAIVAAIAGFIIFVPYLMLILS